MKHESGVWQDTVFEYDQHYELKDLAPDAALI